LARLGQAVQDRGGAGAIVACYIVSGTADFFAEVAVPDLAAYEQLLFGQILTIRHVSFARSDPLTDLAMLCVYLDVDRMDPSRVPEGVELTGFPAPGRDCRPLWPVVRPRG
jgi:DNA-binding Lrp family transcriptional regulator